MENVTAQWHATSATGPHKVFPGLSCLITNTLKSLILYISFDNQNPVKNVCQSGKKRIKLKKNLFQVGISNTKCHILPLVTHLSLHFTVQ